MRQLNFLIISILFVKLSYGQGGSQATANNLPDFIPPTPEAAAMLKADNLTVGYVTGSPNISIPITSLSLNGYSLPISLNYSSTGIKVDEYASMCGMGWTLQSGGVISRTIMGKPDETRNTSNCNLNTLDFSTYYNNSTLLNFLRFAPDKESDIFTYSFPGGSGKFIIGLDGNPIQLARQNLKINVYNSGGQNGFVILTDDGTAYYFLDAETSNSRNPIGSNCEKNYETVGFKTSWYLSKIVLPSTNKQIIYYYDTRDITFEATITQTLSKVISSEDYQCTSGTGPTGAACVLHSERFSTCISKQIVTSKFLNKIETSDGDKIEFFYDATLRTDLENGKRLSSIKVTNRDNLVLSNSYLYGTYKSSITSGETIYHNNRLFLDKVVTKANLAGADSLVYSFNYIDHGNLPSRISYAQDWYGYYNGKTNNPSLLPILSTADVNYSNFNNGTGAVSVTFGDRSVDTVYAIKGLLNKINYPTGGYDTLIYRAARYLDGTVEKLAGGNTINKIISYVRSGGKTLEKEFIYRHKDTNTSSGLLITKSLLFSQINITYKDGYSCSAPGTLPSPYDVGPRCDLAIVTSNASNPISSFGGQHIYYLSVSERVIDQNGDIGLTEHKYQLFGGGNLYPEHKMGNKNLGTPYNIIPDLVIGEYETNLYRNNNNNYFPVSSTKKYFRLDGLTEYYKSYIVKENYSRLTESNPTTPNEFTMFDVDAYYVQSCTVLTDSIVEKEYDESSHELVKKTIFEYGNSAYTYPTRIKIVTSNLEETKVERKYPPDYTTVNFMLNRNIVSPVLEEKHYTNNVLDITRLNTYSDWFSNQTVIAPSETVVKLKNNSTGQRIVFYSYDTYGNVIELSKESDQRITYIWDYLSNHPIAQVANASNGDVAYTSFEASGKGNWSYSGAVTPGANLPTGTKYYKLSAGGITKSGLQTGKTYTVTYWKKDGSGTVTVNSGSGTSVTTINGWTLVSHSITGQTNVTVAGTADIDELRLHPQDAQMTSFTYVPMVGVTSRADLNNRITYYEYDVRNRLTIIRDQDRKIVKKICYNMFGQTENCNACINTTADWQNTNEYDCQKDGSNNNTGYQLRKQVDMNPCSSTYGNFQWVVSSYNTTACPLPVQTVYAKIVYENLDFTGSGTVADIKIKFYSNAACTVPISVSNFAIYFRELYEYYDHNTSNSSYYQYDLSSTANGYEYVIGYSQYIQYYGWDYDEYWDYILLPNSNYVIQ